MHVRSRCDFHADWQTSDPLIASLLLLVLLPKSESHARMSLPSSLSRSTFHVYMVGEGLFQTPGPSAHVP